jgi:hypothetical protein
MGTATEMLHRLSIRTAAYFFNRDMRRADKEICDKHKQWTPLTNQELAQVGKEDRCAYTIFKNMTGDTQHLGYFLSDALYKTKYLPYLNSPNHTPSGSGQDSIFSDKNYAELFMPEFRFPSVIVRRVGGMFFDGDFHPISQEQALSYLQDYDQAVFKQTIETGHGTGIALVQRADYADTLPGFAQDYVVQQVVHQHPSLAYFNESSVNVLRITSLVHRGQVYILGAILRVGPPGCFFDHGVYNGVHYLNIGVHPDGSFYPAAHDVDNGVTYDHVYGKPIEGRIPQYDAMCQLVRQAHIRYPQFQIIGWDITLDDQENIICMEYNTKWPGLFGSQCCLGAIFAQPSVSGRPLLDEIREDMNRVG